MQTRGDWFDLGEEVGEDEMSREEKVLGLEGWEGAIRGTATQDCPNISFIFATALLG